MFTSPNPMSVWLPTSLDFLRMQAQRRGSAGGLVYHDQHTSFAFLEEGARRLASQLARKGLGKGDHVAVMMANEPALVAAMYATWAVGATVVPIGIRATVEEAAHSLLHARCRAVVCDSQRTTVAREAARDAGALALVAEPTLPLRTRTLHGRLERTRTPGQPQSEMLAVITYTSGTTGSPKGVMITHANLWWAAMTCSTARSDRPQTVGACLSPLTHIPVFVSHLLCRLLLGSTAVLVDKFEIDAVLDAVRRHAITDLTLIAGMVFDVTRLGSVPEATRRSVEKVTVGGAPTPMDSKRALAEIFAGAEIIEAYGQSESTDGVTMARGGSVFSHPGTVGSVNPYVSVGVRRRNGRPAETDQEGEVVVAGPSVMKGYYRNKAATEAALSDGWLCTGDLGRFDGDGYLYITGRVKDLIISGGENIAPAEVEDVLRRHPGVADVAVIGTPHPRWGEQVTAIIVAKPGARLDGEALSDYAGKHLAGYKKPRRVEFLEALPRNAANKVQTGMLKERFSGRT